MNQSLPIAVILASFGIAGAEEPQSPAYPEHQDLSYFLDDAGQKQPIRTAADWEVRREHILAGMQAAMGPLPKPKQNVPLGMKVIEETTIGSIRRQKVEYHTDSADRVVRAWLFIPKLEKGQKLPAILCLHQTTKIGKDEPAGLGGLPNLHYAKELAEHGYVTLAPDYPSFGEYEYDFAQHGYASGTMKAIFDNTRAIDLLQSLPQVDGQRLGCIGHSLGGHNTIFTTVLDTRIKAAVSCCGFTRFHKYYGGKLAGWTSSRYMPLIASRYENNPDKAPFDFPELVAAIAPRAFLTVSPLHDGNFDVSGVKDSIAAAAPAFKLLGKESNLRAIYPDCGHDFPEAARKTAYAFLDEQLK
ncbi:MAG TPA: alpha/beta fold hydrolase [Pirellulaceae bacterium]|nr:alpha/beta fold hydrolase [Pirellulaceae bacterium]